MTTPTTLSGRTRLIAALVIAGVFLAGGVVGAAANHLMSAQQQEESGPSGRPFGGPRGAGRGGPPNRDRAPAAILEQRLELTPEQRAAMERIFEARRQRIVGILEDVEPRLQAQRDSTDLEIRAVLTAEQQEEFERILPERRRFRLQVPRSQLPRRQNGPPGGP